MFIHPISQERKEEIIDSIRKGSVPHSGFYIMVILSTLIAGYGLLSNSVAVIIGAMLVAPLMTPIFGLATSLINGDKHLFDQSLHSEFYGVIISIGVALLVGIFSPGIEFESEIISRTTPTLYDIMIALAAGLAGSYSMVDKRISPSLPGVAIATALVPPLAVCGLCLSEREFGHASGALLLFIANFVVIQLSCSAVFWFYGFAPQGQLRSSKDFFRRFGLSIFIFALVSIFLTCTLFNLVNDRQFEKILHATLAEQVHIIPGAKLQFIEKTTKSNNYNIVAVVQTPYSFNPEQVLGIQIIVRDKTNKKINLVIRSVIAHDTYPTKISPQLNNDTTHKL